MNRTATPTADLLIEIGCEDLPARYVMPLAEALAEGIAGGLERRGLEAEAAQPLATPRRVAVQLAAVPLRQPEQVIERAGPALAVALEDGRPTPAGLGFARSCGVPFLALGEKDGKLHYATRQPGRATVELLPEIFEEALKRMDQLVPKRMRWGEGGAPAAADRQPSERRATDDAAEQGSPAPYRGEHTFVRPVQWLLALFGEEVVPLQRFGLTAGRITYGHRFHAPAAIELRAPADYAPALRAARVEVDFARRRDAIRSGVEAEAARLGGTARITGELLDEVTALVEWPVVISGRIEDRFLRLPPEVIVATVETNQRYFTVFSDAPSVEGQVRSASGYLRPAFITVANIESKDVAQIITGNERVVRPRLADALFFWEQDRRQRLEEYAAKFAHVTYQRELGTLAARVARLTALAKTLAERLGEDAPAAERAAALCKCDLGTAMVGEFPELQGLMGGYYARADGEPAAVAEAIRDHYLPTQQDTPIPSTPLGCIVALADKLDALAGYFAIGQKPTATKDPYGLRRAALGIVRILVEGGLTLDLKMALNTALQSQPVGARDAATAQALWSFVMDRLRGYCLGREATVEQFEATLAMDVSDLADFDRRLQALRAFAGTPAAVSLSAAAKRARNLLQQAAQGQAPWPFAFDRFEAAEQALYDALSQVQNVVEPLTAEGQYVQALEILARLKQPVDDFFASVMVMADDPVQRANRIALLSRLDRLCGSVVDLSCLPG